MISPGEKTWDLIYVRNKQRGEYSLYSYSLWGRSVIQVKVQHTQQAVKLTNLTGWCTTIPAIQQSTSNANHWRSFWSSPPSSWLALLQAISNSLEQNSLVSSRAPNRSALKLLPNDRTVIEISSRPLKPFLPPGFSSAFPAHDFDWLLKTT